MKPRRKSTVKKAKKEPVYHRGEIFSVTFRVKAKVKAGFKVVVLGSCEGLDKWSKQGPHKHQMRKVPGKTKPEGDIWESVEPLIMRGQEYFFHYKYALIKDDYLFEWERGVDRVADLLIMPDAEATGDSYNPYEYFFEKGGNKCNSTKHVRFNASWEKLWMSF